MSFEKSIYYNITEMFTWVVFSIMIVLGWDAIVGIRRKFVRRRIFAQAEERATTTGKPLLVIGDPDNGFANTISGSDYSYGDECLDITGCPGAPEDVITHKIPLEEHLPTLEDDSYVIFISCVLEYIPELDEDIVEHMCRVSGDDLFVVRVESYSPTSYIYYGSFLTGESGAKRVILTAPPDDIEITWRDF